MPGTKAQRLEEIRADLGLNKTEMAALLGIDQSYYQHILKGKGKGNLRIEHLERLLAQASINPLWVLTGQGHKIIRISNEIEWEKEPTDEQIDALANYVLEESPVELSMRSRMMFRLACAQCYFENPGVKTLRELAIAARVYLKLILKYPDINLALLFDLQKHIRIEQQD